MVRGVVCYAALCCGAWPVWSCVELRCVVQLSRIVDWWLQSAGDVNFTLTNISLVYGGQRPQMPKQKEEKTQTFAAWVTDHIEMCCISNQNDRSNGSFVCLWVRVWVWVLFPPGMSYVSRTYGISFGLLSVCLYPLFPPFVFLHVYFDLSVCANASVDIRYSDTLITVACICVCFTIPFWSIAAENIIWSVGSFKEMLQMLAVPPKPK